MSNLNRPKLGLPKFVTEPTQKRPIGAMPTNEEQPALHNVREHQITTPKGKPAVVKVASDSEEGHRATETFLRSMGFL